MLTRLAPIGTVAGPRLAGAARSPARSSLRGLAAFSAALGRYEFSGLEPRRPDRTFSGRWSSRSAAARSS